MQQSHKPKNQGGANLLLILSMAAYFGISVIAGVIMIVAVFADMLNGKMIQGSIPTAYLQLITFLAELALIVPTVIFFTQRRGISLKDRLNLHNPGAAALLLCLVIGPFAQVLCMGLQTFWEGGLYQMFGVEQLSGDMQSLMSGSILPALFVIAITPGVIEELLFRGVVLGEYAQTMRKKKAILLSAALFALMHGQFLSLPTTFMMGLILGWLFYETHSIIPGMVLHFSFNATSVLLTQFQGAWQGLFGSEIAFSDMTNTEMAQSAGIALLLIAVGGGIAAGLLTLLRRLSAPARKIAIRQLHITKTYRGAFIAFAAAMGAITLIGFIALLAVNASGDLFQDIQDGLQSGLWQ